MSYNTYNTWASSSSTAYGFKDLQKSCDILKQESSEKEICFKAFDIKKEKFELLFNPDDLDV